MIIDTHCHYNLEPLFSNNERNKIQIGWKEKDSCDIFKFVETWEPYLKKAVTSGVEKSIVVGTNFMSSSVATQLAKQSQHLCASVGSHPMEYQNIQGSVDLDPSESDVQTNIEELRLIVGDKVIAIGECGLDYYHLPLEEKHKEISKHLQRKSLISQIQLAKDYKLPLIVHVRDREVVEQRKEGNAYWDALQILKDNNVKDFVLHCASGPLSYIKEAIEMGGYMGFDGNITYPNAQHIRDIFTIVPEDRRVVETDAPYLPPQPHRGKICEPWMIAETVQYIEENLKVDASSFYENSVRLFKF